MLLLLAILDGIRFQNVILMQITRFYHLRLLLPLDFDEKVFKLSSDEEKIKILSEASTSYISLMCNAFPLIWYHIYSHSAVVYFDEERETKWREFLINCATSS